jgi:hypothetical protein
MSILDRIGFTLTFEENRIVRDDLLEEEDVDKNNEEQEIEKEESKAAA